MVRSRTLLTIALLGVFFGWNVSPAHARSDRVKGARPFESSAETVDLFKAVEQGMLSVKVIPHDSKQCRVFISNESDRVLNVCMPAALAAMPVLAQQIPLGQDPAQNNPATPQRLGVGNPFGQQNPLQMGPNMQGNPLLNQGNQPFFAPFSIAPEKVAQLKLPAVCLDYGRPEPRPAMRYRLEPLAAVGGSKELESLCRRLGRELIPQRVAQAAAWHFSNAMTWEDMAGMVVRCLGRPNERFFTSKQIQSARQLVDAIEEEAKPQTGKNPSASSLTAAH